MDAFEISAIFRNIANILEINGENVFRIRAYQKAAETLERLPDTLESLIKEDKLTEIPGIGKDLAGKIKEYYQTGKIKEYEKLKKTIPQGLLELLDIPSVGPKTVELLFKRLKVKSIADLQRAIDKNLLTGLPGIKEKTIQNITRGLEIVKKDSRRMTLQEATWVAEAFLPELKKLKEVTAIQAAGSLRRGAETIGDIDLLIASDKPEKIMDTFVKLPAVKTVLGKGPTKSSIRTKTDVQVDCRVVEEKSFGAALVYFTGSKDFNIKLRQMAIKKDLKISEYGVFSAKDERFICGRTEEEVFKQLGMAYIAPELRENRGEIELAIEGRQPELLELSDIKGDLHVHSEWSDGLNSIAEMAKAAKALGYSYIAVCDHSQSLKIADGLSVKALMDKKRQIDKINAGLKGFRVLMGAEVDIDSEGKLDYKDSVLKELDIVVGALHSGFKQNKEQLTKRIVKACSNKYVNIIAHPTGRLFGARAAYELDFYEVFKAAHETNTALEINSFPDRLDLNDINTRMAVGNKVKLAVNTDSHRKEHLGAMQFGVAVARRGWASKEDVLNTLPLESLLKKIKK